MPERGDPPVVPSVTVRLAEAADAYHLLATNTLLGKVILDLAP